MPGPGAAEEPDAPGRGFTEADLLLEPVSAVREALLWRELGDVPGWGMGEARRAVASALGREVP